MKIGHRFRIRIANGVQCYLVQNYYTENVSLKSWQEMFFEDTFLNMICQIRNSKVLGRVWRKSLANFANRRNGYTFVLVCQYRSIVRAIRLTSKILVIWSFTTHYYHIINWLYGNVSNVCIQITKCINFTKSHSRRSTDYSGIGGRCSCT